MTRRRVLLPLLLLMFCLPPGTLDDVRAAADPTLLLDSRHLVGISTDGRYLTLAVRGRNSYEQRYYTSLWEARPARLIPLEAFWGSGPWVDDGIIVWNVPADPGCGVQQCANLDIVALEPASGRTFTVASGSGFKNVTSVSDGLVTWTVPGPDGDVLWGRDLRTMAPQFVILPPDVAPAPWRRWDMAVSRRHVVWSERQEAGGLITRWRLRQRPVAGGQPVTIAEGEGRGIFNQGINLLFRGHIALYEVDRIPYAHDVTTGQTKALHGYWQRLAGVVFDGRYAFATYSAFSSLPDPEGRRPGLWAYDVLTDSVFPVTENTLANVPDTAGGGVVVWRRGEVSRLPVFEAAIHAAKLADVVPSAPREGASGPDRLFFPETGHALAFGFKTFWERSSGLPVFGYPLTEEFEQRNADTGRLHTVQYLERQRFEYHPDLAGTPYEVQLGRLGAEDAARRNLAGIWAFQPVPADAQHPPGCIYITETRHRLCGEFRPYWEGHGLELGDAGVSFREALALFGYPISQEFIDPQTGLITQYFERAVFEYHPNNPLPHRVLLRRLGAERLAASGW